MIKCKSILLLFFGLCSAFSCLAQDTIFENVNAVNSINDDYLPYLADSFLLFTSNRKNTQEGQMLEYTEKVYLSEKVKGKWDNPKKNGYKWNSDNNSALVGMSSENYYFYRSYMNDNGELFSSKRKESKKSWKAQSLKKLTDINSEFDENSIAEGNGDTVYFVSNRSGNYDIYQQVGKTQAQSIDSINTLYDEVDVFVTEDAKAMYFSSNRPGGKGDYDIYKSSKIGNSWSLPENVEFPNVNSDSTDRDFRIYNDSTLFFSSNRSGGLGGMDIYQITLKNINKEPIVKVDTVKKVDSVVVVQPVKDSTNSGGASNVVSKMVANENQDIAVKIIEKPIVQSTDTIVTTDVHDELIDELKKMGLFPFKGEVQLGAYRRIKSIENFKEKYKCVKFENLRMDSTVYEGITIYRFIINKIYTDVDDALNKQLEIINKHCLPEANFNDMPFIGLLDKDNNRFAIFWKKDEFMNKKVFYIFQNGKQIWKSKRF